MLLDVVAVTVLPPHTLVLEFENGERRLFDMTALLNERPFRRLRDSPLFFLARVENGTVAWPGNIDIAPETLYDGSQKQPSLRPTSPARKCGSKGRRRRAPTARRRRCRGPRRGDVHPVAFAHRPPSEGA